MHNIAFEKFKNDTNELAKVCNESSKMLESGGHLPFNNEKRYRFGKDEKKSAQNSSFNDNYQSIIIKNGKIDVK